MKFIIALLLTLMLVSSIATSQNITISPKRRSSDLYLDYTVRDGTTAYYMLRDTMSVLGTGDTLVSRAYETGENGTSVQIGFYGGTPKITVKIQSCDSRIAADSLFQDLYWLRYAGTGITNCVTSTADDSVTTTGRTAPLRLYGLGRLWRLYIISKSTQSGNTLIEGDVTTW
jgi:hypothetical protein